MLIKLVLAHQFRDIGFQDGGQLAQHEQGWIPDATLDLADVGSVEISAQGERFLRQPFLASQYPNVDRKLLAYLIIFPSHALEDAGDETINPRIIINK